MNSEHWLVKFIYKLQLIFITLKLCGVIEWEWWVEE